MIENEIKKAVRTMKEKKNERVWVTWSCLTFIPLAGHQKLDDLDVGIQAWFTTAEVRGGKKKKK